MSSRLSRPPRSKPISQRRAASLLAYWQEALSLRDWTLTIAVCDRKTLPEEDGAVSWMEDRQEAHIWLRRFQSSPEETLVHELLHVVYEGEMECDAAPPDRERAHNKVARALVALRTSCHK